MNFAKLDRQIVLRRNTPSQDALGEVVNVWSDFLSCFAQRLSRPGREFFSSSKVVNESRVYFVIRHAEGIDPQQQVVDGEKTYEITDVLYSDKRGESIQLECKEIV